MKKKPAPPTIRSSAAEYLTFVAATGDAPQSIEMRYEDENIWLTQKMLAELYGVSIPAINQHRKWANLKRIVSAYLDMAEVQAMRQIPMTMEDWEKYRVIQDRLYKSDFDKLLEKISP
jgi:hypothetical protein